MDTTLPGRRVGHDVDESGQPRRERALLEGEAQVQRQEKTVPQHRDGVEVPEPPAEESRLLFTQLYLKEKEGHNTAGKSKVYKVTIKVVK